MIFFDETEAVLAKMTTKRRVVEKIGDLIEKNATRRFGDQLGKRRDARGADRFFSGPGFDKGQTKAFLRRRLAKDGAEII